MYHLPHFWSLFESLWWNSETISFYLNSAWQNRLGTNLIIRVKWLHKYLIGTSYPNQIVFTKTNEYTGQMNLCRIKIFGLIVLLCRLGTVDK